VRLVLHAKIAIYITTNGQQQQLKEWFNTFVNCKGINNKKAVLSQGNRAMPQLFFSV